MAGSTSWRVCVIRVWVGSRNRKGWRNTGLNPFYFIFLGRFTPRCYNYIYNIHHIILLWITKNIKGVSPQYNIILYPEVLSIYIIPVLQIFFSFFLSIPGKMTMSCSVCTIPNIIYRWYINLYTLKLVQTLILVLWGQLNEHRCRGRSLWVERGKTDKCMMI